jgi:hypothetical protein
LQDSIVAQKYSPEKKANIKPEDIDWLLLTPKTGVTPIGVFNNAIYVQRIATTGGIPPAAAPTSSTQTVEVEYTAVYRFSKQN